MVDLVERFRDRWSAALVADSAYRAGVEVRVAPSAIRPLAPRARLAGPVRTVRANNDLVAVLAAVHRAAEGDVLVIGNRTREVAVIGDLIGAEAARKGLGGVIVDTMVRDRADLAALELPVFCRGTVPVGPLKLTPEVKGIGELDVAIELDSVAVEPGWWAFGDGDGVVFVAAGAEEAIAEQATLAEEREAGLRVQMRDGHALGDLLGIEEFWARRQQDPSADFNRHLQDIGRAI